MTNTYTIEKNYIERECFHEHCFEMHKRFVTPGNSGVHFVEETFYTVTEDATGRTVENYDTRRDAVYAVKSRGGVVAPVKREARTPKVKAEVEVPAEVPTGCTVTVTADGGKCGKAIVKTWTGTTGTVYGECETHVI